MTTQSIPVAPSSPREPSPSTDQVAQRYRERYARFDAERRRLESWLRWVGYGRLATFCLALAVVVWAVVSGVPQLLLGALAWVAVFVGLVFYNERLSRQHRRHQALARLSDEGLRRLARDWDAL